jgi:small-conductance mechanosensitive channel
MPQPGQGALQQADAQFRAAANDVDLSGVQPLLDFRLLHVSGITITLGGVLLALLVAAAVWLLSRLSTRALARFAQHHKDVNQAALYTVSRLVNYLFLVGGLLLAMDVAGIPIGKFSVFAGALGVGLGFGLQAIFNNFISGLILLFDRSIKVGDFVELDGEIRGTVRAIGLRSTRVTTNDNIAILVPNSEFMTKRVVNWTYRSVNRRIRVPFGVAYGTDKERVKKAALEAATRVPFTLTTEGERGPQVWLVGFGDSSVDFLLVVWLNEAASRRYTSVMAAYLWELDTALKTHGIEMPFPQRDLRVRSLFGMEGPAALAALRGEVVAAETLVAPSAPPLPARERETLSRNDAQADAERQIREEAAERAARPASEDGDDADVESGSGAAP